MVNHESSLERWYSCRYGTSFGLFAGDEAGYALDEEGYNENYLCECPEVVEAGNYRVVEYPEGDTIVRLAMLHAMGKYYDSSVINALGKACTDCPFYKK